MSRFLSQKYAELTPYVPGEQPRDKRKYVKLNTNESPFSPSPRVAKAIDLDAINGLNLYSDPTAKVLNMAFAEYFKVSSDMVMTSNGSDEILAFCFDAFGDKGVIFNDITYGFYKVYAEHYGLKSTVLPLRKDFTIDIESYNGLKGTVFIANPNAPTGIALDSLAIESILKQDLDRLIVVDEAYVDFGAESSVKLLDTYSNLIVVGTFSKSRSLAGARLGYCIAGKELIDDINKMKYSFNPYNVNMLTQLIGIAAIADEDYFVMTRDTIINNREILKYELQSLGATVLPSKANFVFASFFGITGEEYYNKLKEEGILVRYFNTPRLKNFVRITVGSIEQIDYLIAATKKIRR